jgi:polysaccharide export outer membrane protein
MKEAADQAMRKIRGMTMLRWLTLLAGLSLSVALISCAPTPPPLTLTDGGATPGYMLDSGDKLRINVFNEEKLTGDYSISPAGTVAFPLIGAITARGLTADQLAAALTSKLKTFVNEPRVAAEVLSYRPYYILGEVNRPGEYPFTNGLRIEQAIAAAGGFTYRANQKRVFVQRGDQGERTVPLRDSPVRVLPGDTIRVGERYF